MMTVKNIGSMLDLLEANYGSALYKDTNRENVVKLWSVMFAEEDPHEVLTAVKEYIETESFPPRIADLKRIIRKNKRNSQTKTISEVIEEANRLSAAHGMKMTDELRERTAEKVKRFRCPVTAIEIKIVESRENRKAERFLK